MICPWLALQRWSLNWRDLSILWTWMQNHTWVWSVCGKPASFHWQSIYKRRRWVSPDLLSSSCAPFKPWFCGHVYICQLLLFWKSDTRMMDVFLTVSSHHTLKQVSTAFARCHMWRMHLRIRSGLISLLKSSGSWVLWKETWQKWRAAVWNPMISQTHCYMAAGCQVGGSKLAWTVMSGEIVFCMQRHGVDLLGELPAGVLCKIFHLLPLSDRARMEAVAKRFISLSRETDSLSFPTSSTIEIAGLDDWLKRIHKTSSQASLQSLHVTPGCQCSVQYLKCRFQTI